MLEQLLAIVAESFEQGGHGEFPAPVDAHMKDILDIEFQVDP